MERKSPRGCPLLQRAVIFARSLGAGSAAFGAAVVLFSGPVPAGDERVYLVQIDQATQLQLQTMQNSIRYLQVQMQQITQLKDALAQAQQHDKEQAALIEQRFNKIDSALSGSRLLELVSQVETLNADLNRLRGELELVRNQLDKAEKRERNTSTELNERLKKLEQASVTGGNDTDRGGTKASSESEASAAATAPPTANAAAANEASANAASAGATNTAGSPAAAADDARSANPAASAAGASSANTAPNSAGASAGVVSSTATPGALVLIPNSAAATNTAPTGPTSINTTPGGATSTNTTPSGAASTNTTPSGAVVASNTKPAARDPVAENKLYDEALRLFRGGNYLGAIVAFQNFTDKYPGSALAPNARYWIGVSYFNQRDFAKAMQSNQALIKEYPDSAKVPDAMLNMASVYVEQSDYTAARGTLEEVIAKFPASDAAAKARTRLTLLKK
jgi:tol-pal system protein YbgF